jgi:L-alanine-DL-glutamate epimerase-like enolase superfamily enzyme
MIPVGTSIDNGYVPEEVSRLVQVNAGENRNESCVLSRSVNERSRSLGTPIPSGGLTTSAVALMTKVVRNRRPIVGYGFASIGRFGQAGLIRERFGPRLLAARDSDLVDQAGTNFDPLRAWKLMMAGEKPGGHGERCVAVGTLDMALWDAAAKIAGVPLYRHLGDRLEPKSGSFRVQVYAGGGYYYPSDDVGRLKDEVRRLTGLGYQRVKIKIGAAPLCRSNGSPQCGEGGEHRRFRL